MVAYVLSLGSPIELEISSVIFSILSDSNPSVLASLKSRLAHSGKPTTGVSLLSSVNPFLTFSNTDRANGSPSFLYVDVSESLIPIVNTFTARITFPAIFFSKSLSLSLCFTPNTAWVIIGIPSLAFLLIVFALIQILLSCGSSMYLNFSPFSL